MKEEQYKTILKKFKNNSKISFFNNKFYFNSINNFDDLLIKGNLKTKKPQAISILFRHKQPQEVNDNKKENIKLVQTNESLTDVGAITSIFFEKQTIKDIQRVIKKSNSTYLRIFNNEKNIQISIFDYRQFIPRTRLLRQKSFQYYNLPTSDEQVEKFSKTIKANSFLILPNKDLWLRINQNNIVTFSDEDTETKYLIREQDINEPVCIFVNPKLMNQLLLYLQIYPRRTLIMKLKTQFKDDWTSSFYTLVYLLVNIKERKKPTEINTLKLIKNGHLKSI